MIDMPPGIPNGCMISQTQMAQIVKNIMTLTPEEARLIYCEENIPQVFKDIAEKCGIEFTYDYHQAKILILTPSIDAPQEASPHLATPKIPIYIPIIAAPIHPKNVGRIIENIETLPGPSMGIQLESNINTTNAIIFALQIASIYHPQLKQELALYRENLAREVRVKDRNHLHAGILQLAATTHISLPQRYQLGNTDYHHSGKVRETIQHPDDADCLIMIATDRISTHDVVHRVGVPGKGEALTSISNYWFSELAKDERTKDIPTQLVEHPTWPDDFPEELKSRSIIVRKLEPLKVEAVIRKHLTGSGLKAWNIHLDLQECRNHSYFEILSINEKKEIFDAMFPNRKYSDFQKDILDNEWKWEEKPEFE